MSAAGRFFVTPHAVRRYVSRVRPGLTYEQALGALLQAAESAHYVRDSDGGAAIWRASRAHGRVRFVVMPGVPGRLPVIVTILREHDGAAAR